MDAKIIGVRLDPEKFKLLSVEATSKGTSVSGLIRMWAYEKLEENQRRDT